MSFMYYFFGRMALRLRGAGVAAEGSAWPLRGEAVLKNKKKVSVILFVCCP